MPSPQRSLFLIDSITQIQPFMAGGVIVSGSHGGVSSSRYVEEAPQKPLAVFFNDAGVGKHSAGIAALSRLEPYGILAFCYGHDSACIGQAQDAIDHGRVTFVNITVQKSGLLQSYEGKHVADIVGALLEFQSTGPRG